MADLLVGDIWLCTGPGIMRNMGALQNPKKEIAKASFPQVLNTALMTAACGYTLSDARADSEFWGRLVESALGAHLAGAAQCGDCRLHYWRDGNHEVDFVVHAGGRLTAIEVKSGHAPLAQPGKAAFAQAFKSQRCLLVGGDGVALEDFLSQPVQHRIVDRA